MSIRRICLFARTGHFNIYSAFLLYFYPLAFSLKYSRIKFNLPYVKLNIQIIEMQRSVELCSSLLRLSDQVYSKFQSRYFKNKAFHLILFKLYIQASLFHLQSSDLAQNQPDASTVMKLYSRVHPRLLRFVNSFDDVLGIREIREAQSRVLAVSNS